VHQNPDASKGLETIGHFKQLKLWWIQVKWRKS